MTRADREWRIRPRTIREGGVEVTLHVVQFLRDGEWEEDSFTVASSVPSGTRWNALARGYEAEKEDEHDT